MTELPFYQTDNFAFCVYECLVNLNDKAIGPEYCQTKWESQKAVKTRRNFVFDQSKEENSLAANIMGISFYDFISCPAWTERGQCSNSWCFGRANNVRCLSSMCQHNEMRQWYCDQSKRSHLCCATHIQCLRACAEHAFSRYELLPWSQRQRISFLLLIFEGPQEHTQLKRGPEPWRWTIFPCMFLRSKWEQLLGGFNWKCFVLACEWKLILGGAETKDSLKNLWF